MAYWSVALACWVWSGWSVAGCEHAVPFTEGYAFREATSRQRFREHLIKAGLPE